MAYYVGEREGYNSYNSWIICYGQQKNRKIMKNRKLIKLDDAKSLMQFLKQSTVEIAETLTGVLASDLKDWKLSAGRIVQAVIKGNLLTQLGSELRKYQEEGKIKEDYLATDATRSSFKELLKYIDEEVPDEIRFKAMKSIFLSSVSQGATETEELLAYELMQLCRQLSSGEIVLLKAIYDISKNRLAPGVSNVIAEHGASYWLKNVAKQIGHNDVDLVELHEDKLMKLHLITGRMYNDRSGVNPSNTNRLTSLGIKLCEFITRYE
jgi:hypothetical protein